MQDGARSHDKGRNVNFQENPYAVSSKKPAEKGNSLRKKSSSKSVPLSQRKGSSPSSSVPLYPPMTTELMGSEEEAIGDDGPPRRETTAGRAHMQGRPSFTSRKNQ